MPKNRGSKWLPKRWKRAFVCRPSPPLETIKNLHLFLSPNLCTCAHTQTHTRCPGLMTFYEQPTVLFVPLQCRYMTAVFLTALQLQTDTWATKQPGTESKTGRQTEFAGAKDRVKTTTLLNGELQFTWLALNRKVKKTNRRWPFGVILMGECVDGERLPSKSLKKYIIGSVCRHIHLTSTVYFVVVMQLRCWNSIGPLKALPVGSA